jgi:hypothetical protein
MSAERVIVAFILVVFLWTDLLMVENAVMYCRRLD